jgi:hypothetical protein
METVEFLRAVVPSGLIVIARWAEKPTANGGTRKVASHIICKDHEEAAAVVASLGQQDVYYALAAYKQGFHLNAKGKRVLRVRENVDSLKALWLDIDFKGEYPDARTALLAVKVFCQQAKMPAPSLVIGSGNGVHVYWPLTAAVPLDRWQRLTDSFKEAARTIGLKADLVCTADACRILRPPGTFNCKDPGNIKPVSVLYSSGELFDFDTLSDLLLPWAPTAKPPGPALGVNSDLTGGVGAAVPRVPSRFEEVVKHCRVAKWHLETNGKDCSEPEWVAILQLLKHCEDGVLYVHEVSKGHLSYSAGSTDQKWQDRLANTAGPTLCKTFELYRPEKCAVCPHNGFIKTPLQVGLEGTEDITGLPFGWRIAPDEKGVERLMLTDPALGTKEWIKQFRHLPSNFRPVKSVVTGEYEMLMDIRLKGTDAWTVTLPMSMLGNTRKLVEQLAAFGVVLKSKEVQPFGDLMSSWLEKLQNARRVADVADQMGWVQTKGTISGFACGPVVFHEDGRIRNDVRPSREFGHLAKLYEPRGELDEWKRIAKFVADQNNPALTTVLAASFGAPLLKFVGIHGGILSLVSQASGVGKTSILKLSQAVWGSPVHAMNSVDDTPKSVAKKLGFVNNLPAYWDELRGKQTVDGFCNLAFQITQGREKSRLDSGANLRSSQTWETMLIVASNESIFDAMASRTTGSDAGMVRTFEIEMLKAPYSEKPAAEITLMFETLHHNYGAAGRIYAQHLATHWQEIEKMVKETFISLAGSMESSERFWYGMMSIIIVGAILAKRLELVDIDIKAMHKFLMLNLTKLKGRTGVVAQESSWTEIFADYLRERGDRTLIIDKFYEFSGGRGRPGAAYLPLIIGSPKSEKIAIVIAQEQKRMRFATRDFSQWLKRHEIQSYGFKDHLQQKLGATELRCILGLGTSYAGPRVWAMEIDTNAAGYSNLDENPGSSTSTEPAG